MSKDTKLKQTPILTVVLAAIIVLLTAAFLPPVLIPSGVEQYTGEMKKAAEAQLRQVPELRDGYSLPALKYRVEKITETPAKTAESWCGPAHKPGQTYYSVTISEYTFFGIKTAEYIRHDSCILM